MVSMCCSAIPTSKARSGNRSANASTPVEPGMAAVSATRSGWRSPASRRASTKATLYSGAGDVDRTGPMAGSNSPVSWRWLSPWSSAGL